MPVTHTFIKIYIRPIVPVLYELDGTLYVVLKTVVPQDIVVKK